MDTLPLNMVTTPSTKPATVETITRMDYQPCLSYHLTKGDKYRFYSLATDANGQKVAIGSERNLFVLVLSQDGGEKEEQCTLNKITTSKDTSSIVLEWCKDKSKSNLIAASNANNILIWDINDEKCIFTNQKSHQRHITSLSWNSIDSNILASGSGDSFIKIWDTRESRAPTNSVNTQSILNQVSWNPHSSSMIASSHAGEVKIWDTRKFGSPLISFTAHIGSIPSIDWHYKEKSTILSCGSDKTIKVWDVTPPTKLKRSYLTGSPCNQTKFVPFSNQQAIASISQKGYNEISIWSGSNHSSILHLTGHVGPVIDFDWRVNQNDKFNYVVSIGRDNYFRMWKFNNDMINHIDNFISSPETFSCSTSSSIKPLDLRQELIRIEQEKFKHLSIEKTNIASRICVVNIENRKIIIIITFPSLYPLASPSFEILIKSTPSVSTNEIKVKLKKELDNLSFELIETKKPFLYQLLKSFDAYYESNNDSYKVNQIKDSVDSPAIEKRSHHHMGNLPIRLNIENTNHPVGASGGLPPLHHQSLEVPNTKKSPKLSNSFDLDTATSSDELLKSPTIISSSTSMDQISGSAAAAIGGIGSRIRSNSSNSTLDVIQNKNRGNSIGSINNGTFAPLPPNIPYNNGTQSILFEMYVVKPTDTLTGIALQFNMPRDVLIQSNRLFTEKIIPGTILWVYKKKVIDVNSNNDHSILENQLLSMLHSSGSESESSDNEQTTTTTTSNTTPNNMLSPSIPSITVNSQQQGGLVIGTRQRSRSNNINDLFKPVKEEVELAFQTLNFDTNNNSNSNNLKLNNKSTSPRLSGEQQKEHLEIAGNNTNNNNRYSWGSHRLPQIPKENVFKEDLVCFMKDKRLLGTLTLTPYQFIFQSKSSTYQIFTDYNQIISCKYFPNKHEWIAHLSKDWNKEQYIIKKKNKEENEEYDQFIQSEISKLNEMEEENTKVTIDNQERKVLVFPCIYVLIHKDKHIQTLFIRGVEEESVHRSFSFLKKLIVDHRDSSPLSGVSPPLTSQTRPTNLPPPIPIKLPALNVIPKSSSFEEYSYSPKLLKDNSKYGHQDEVILLTSDIFKKLRHYLPMRLQSSDVELRYNNTTDGVSFSTFYRKMKNAQQSILLVKDNAGYIFGAYLSEEIKTKDPEFYGNGETFLFALYPEFRVYKWSKENDFFIYTCNEYIVIGGGTTFGLWMDTDFAHGYSGVCETFKNSKLSHTNDFSPIVVEAWSIG